MWRLALAVAASLGLLAATSLGTSADINLTETTQATLSCSDGHSGVLYVDQTTLTSLVSDVNTINLSGSGVTCSLDTASIDPSMETSDWTVYDYNPSDRAIAPRNSPNSGPATTSDGGVTWQFPFLADIYTALFTTTDPTVTGNDSGKTLKDTITLSGDAASFMTQFFGANCVDSNVPAVVRYYFTAPSASGPSPQGGAPHPAGFYTQFWWSDGIQAQMLHGNQVITLTEEMSPADWSDWNGQPATEIPDAFNEAASHVQSIGLSFGGECQFETGVTPTGTFTTEQLSNQFTAA
jgi:hypothetical protein